MGTECLKRALREGEAELMDTYINGATKLLRTFTAQMEALNRHRGAVSEQMIVGDVNVSKGGQTIVDP